MSFRPMGSQDDRDDEPPARLARLTQGRLSRGLELGRALLGAAGRSASQRLRGESSDSDPLVGEALARTLGELKGLPMKLGQMLSYVDLQAPDALQSALSRLQHDSTPLAPELVAQTVREDLGAEPSALFASWNPLPVAAASIGQVHRARLADGTEVAVKVRYAAVDRVMRDDLQSTALLRHALGLMAPGMDAAALLLELRERFLEECDYRLEAENQRAFRAFFDAEPEIDVPEVYARYSSERVLTTRFVHGVRFEELLRAASPAERDRAARALHNFAFASIFRFGALNCDPHPGNYLFTPSGVAFLDFGCVRRFSPALLSAWRRMLRAALERDLAAFRQAVLDVGLARPGARFDFNAHYGQYLFLLRPWLTEQPVGLPPEYVTRTYRALLLDNPNRRQLSMPRELLFANRLQWGLFSLLARLGSTLSLRREILEILYEPGEARPEPFSEAELRRYLRAPPQAP